MTIKRIRNGKIMARRGINGGVEQPDKDDG